MRQITRRQISRALYEKTHRESGVTRKTRSRKIIRVKLMEQSAGIANIAGVSVDIESLVKRDIV